MDKLIWTLARAVDVDVADFQRFVLDGLARPRVLAGPDEADLRAAYDVMAAGR